MAKKKVEPSETTSTGQSIEAVMENERILPEAGAVVNLDISWHGKVMRYTVRAFDDAEMIEKLTKLEMMLPEMGMEIVSMKGTPVKKGEAKPTAKAKGTPKKAEPEGIIDEVTIDITSIYVGEGKRGNYAYVKGTPGFEEDGAVCYEDAWEGSGYNLKDQAPGKFYDPVGFGFVQAVIRLGDKPRVWKLLTQREIPF